MKSPINCHFAKSVYVRICILWVSVIALKMAKVQLSLPKTIEFSFVLSSAVIKTVGAQINAIWFIIFQADVRTFEITITV